MTVANVVRMHDCHLGDSENTGAGQEAARMVPGATRDAAFAVLENREFLKHIARICESLCPGCYLPICLLTGENPNSDALGQIAQTYNRAIAPLAMRTKHHIYQFFSGAELIEPGLVYLAHWRHATEYCAGGGTRWAHARIGRKAGPDANIQATNDADFAASATAKEPLI